MFSLVFSLIFMRISEMKQPVEVHCPPGVGQCPACWGLASHDPMGSKRKLEPAQGWTGAHGGCLQGA